MKKAFYVLLLVVIGVYVYYLVVDLRYNIALAKANKGGVEEKVEFIQKYNLFSSGFIRPGDFQSLSVNLDNNGIKDFIEKLDYCYKSNNDRNCLISRNTLATKY